MFLAVDIGNSNVKFGVFDGAELVTKYTIPTPREPIADSAAFLPSELTGPIDAALVCSVVPEANSASVAALSDRFGITARVVDNHADFGLDIRYTPLAAAGTDRLVGSFAAAGLFGTPCVVVSFGTALTVDAVNADRVLLGGIIAPGPRVMARALSLSTSRLPEVELTELDSTVIQTTTNEAIRSGILNGYLGMAERLIESVRAECDPSARVVATGGYAGFVADHLELIDSLEPDLVLKGLRLCYDRLKRKDYA
jgi:type III pantothenate kinase